MIKNQLPIRGVSGRLKFVIIVLVAIAIVFRFTHLDRKVYWHDEVHTSLRVSGYIAGQVTEEIFRAQRLGVEDLQRYQHLTPELGIDDTLKSLMIHVEHPPLYYLLTRLWMDGLGSSVAIVRSFSAIISLLAFPLLYLLCEELFATPGVGWVAIALLSVSPFHVLYAQEARQYSLWTVTILLSSLTLLRAVRLNTARHWIVYTLAAILNLYTTLVSLFVTLGQGIWVVFAENFGWTSRLKRAILSLSFAGLGFTPWMVLLIAHWAHFRGVTQWSDKAPSNFPLIKLWGLHISSPFIDFQISSLDSPYVWIAPLLIFFLLIPASIYLIKSQPKRVWLFLLSFGISALPLILPDLLLGGMRSSNSRYFIPIYIGLQLTFSYFIYGLLSAKIRWKSRLGQGILTIIITVGIVSCLQSSQAQVWWNKGWSDRIVKAIAVINQAPSPLIISSPSSTNLGDLLSLSYLVNPTTQFWLIREQHFPSIPATVEEFKTNYDLFLFNPSDEIKQAIAPNYTLESIPNSRLVKITE